MSEEATKRIVSKGKCNFCNQVIAKSSMTRHLQSCKARQAANAAPSSGKVINTKVFHLSIEGTHANMYWMHIEIPTSTTLIKLDQFLRDIWLECCGHLSQFEIGGIQYAIDRLYGSPVDLDFSADNEQPVADPDGWRFPTMFPLTKRMSKFKLEDLLETGVKFTHEYDFGSTTDITLKVIGEREAQIKKKDDITILARNIPPEIMCDVCGKKLATHLCMACVYEDKGALCLSCAKKHPHDHYDMFMPVVNSPRVGVCGYTGDAPDSWVFWEQ